MERLCDRPGCSDHASVAYGMRAPDLVFWLDALPTDDRDVGVLCRRHADSMAVPRGWTLDDLRDPDLHLFRPPRPESRAPTLIPSRRASRPVVDRRVLGEQMELPSVVDDAAARAGTNEAGRTAGPWTPDFDEADDLDGLLTARSPLLSRAFRTADRPGA